MKLPQTLVIAYFIARLFIHAINHGEPIKHPNLKYNFVSDLIVILIVVAVLYWGGFFDCLL